MGLTMELFLSLINWLKLEKKEQYNGLRKVIRILKATVLLCLSNIYLIINRFDSFVLLLITNKLVHCKTLGISMT